MAHGISITIEASGIEIGPMRERLGDLRPFLHTLNLQVLSNAQLTLRDSVKGQERTNRLARSLQPGNLDNIDKVASREATVGTALEYAGKVNDGGPIFPSEAKMLAIPLTDFLRSSTLQDNWPRDFDPGRERFRLMPALGGEAAVLFDPEDDNLRWLLVKSTIWNAPTGEGYHYLDWDQQNLDDAESLYFDILYSDQPN